MHSSDRGGFLRTKKGNQRGDQGPTVPGPPQGFPGPPRGPHGQAQMRPMAPWGGMQNQFQNRSGGMHRDHRPHAAARAPMAAQGHNRPFQPRPHASHQTGGFQRKAGTTGLPRGMVPPGPPSPRPPAAEAPLPPPRPPVQAHQQAPRGPSGSPATLKATSSDFREFASVSVPASEVARVSYLERARAMNALAGIGGAAKAAHKPAAVKAAATAFRNGTAFRASPFGDDVSDLVPESLAAAGADDS